jgi:hypothetical protein
MLDAAIVVIYSDVTVALPLIATYALKRAEACLPQELYTRRQEMLSALRQAYMSDIGKTEADSSVLPIKVE